MKKSHSAGCARGLPSQGRVRGAIACSLALFLAGCHDHHGYVDWSDGVMRFYIRGIGPDFSCDDPGDDWRLSNEDRVTMCAVAEHNKGECPKVTRASFGVTKDDSAPGGHTFDFTCGQKRHH